MTVREAVLEYMDIPHFIEFSGHRLICFVRSVLPFGENPYDGTILRELRLLRQQGEINYKVICKKKSLYRKLK